MKKTILFFALLVSLSCVSQKTDSLAWYKDKVKADSIQLMQQEKQFAFEKGETVPKTEMEEMEKFYKERIDKLQTLLIAACASSALVIIAAFYMLNKKKKQDALK